MKQAIMLFIASIVLSGCSLLKYEAPQRSQWDQIPMNQVFDYCSDEKTIAYVDTIVASPYILLGSIGLAYGAVIEAAYFYGLGLPFSFSAYYGWKESDKCREFKEYKNNQLLKQTAINASPEKLSTKLLELKILKEESLISEGEYKQLKAKLLGAHNKRSVN